MADNDMEIIFIVVAVGLLVVIPLIIVASIRQDHAFSRRCRDIGGVVRSHTDTVTTVGVGSGGRPAVGVGTSQTRLCLSPDGRILDIEN